MTAWRLLGFIHGFLFFGAVLLGFALVYNVPLLVAARLARRRLPPLVPKVAFAVCFSLAAAYTMWRMEWFDLWRHGVPPVRHLLGVYLPYVVVLACCGWFVGGLVVRESAALRRT